MPEIVGLYFDCALAPNRGISKRVPQFMRHGAKEWVQSKITEPPQSFSVNYQFSSRLPRQRSSLLCLFARGPAVAIQLRRCQVQ